MNLESIEERCKHGIFHSPEIACIQVWNKAMLRVCKSEEPQVSPSFNFLGNWCIGMRENVQRSNGAAQTNAKAADGAPNQQSIGRRCYSTHSSARGQNSTGDG